MQTSSSQPRFIIKKVGRKWRVYDTTRYSFPYQTTELGKVKQDTTEELAAKEADRLNKERDA